MQEISLEQREEMITASYREFLSKVREAFDKHCEDIKTEATRKLEAVPEENVEARQKVLDEQNALLDKTLLELKQLLAKKEAEVRAKLEEIANLKDQGAFSMEEELSDIEELGQKHAA